MGEQKSQLVTSFRERPLPERASLAGYAALMERYGLRLPLPPRLAAIATRHAPKSTHDWLLLTPRHAPARTLAGELTFALKWEGVDLSVCAALFATVGVGEIAEVVRATPNGIFARRIWYLFEWLTGRELDIPPLGKVRTTPVVDDTLQFAIATGTPSPRHKVVDNLPGTRAFCPMVRRTPRLSAMVAKRLDLKAREVIGRTRRDLVSRAAAFMLLNDSKSSFAIEGVKPTRARAARWGQAIAEAGGRVLSIDELERLQRIVVGDDRFVRLGLRSEGGFVGSHDRITGEPVPDHVSARWQDLRDLLAGIVAYDDRAVANGLDPVVAAAAVAFGFVYVHPFEDGNGRLHRWLMHHVLAMADFNPRAMVFPVSAVILRRLSEYRAVLESYSSPLLPFIEWQPTSKGNLEVLNATADYYRYFDATAHAEFLYACVEQTVDDDLPREVAFLERFERFKDGVREIVDMPDRAVERLRAFLENGSGTLSQRARTNEFTALTTGERAQLEELYAKTFNTED